MIFTISDDAKRIVTDSDIAIELVYDVPGEPMQLAGLVNLHRKSESAGRQR